MLPNKAFFCLIAIEGARALVSVPSITAEPLNAESDIVRAVIPTTSGQIGINPVISDLGDPKTYIGQIFGTDTLYITLVSVTAFTIGDNTEYLTEPVAVATTSWIATNTSYLAITTLNPTSTSTVRIVVATATEASVTNSVGVGDISIILPEGLALALKASTDTALEACKIPAVVIRRDSSLNQRDEASTFVACLASAGVQAATDGGFFESFIESEAWEAVGVTVSEGLSTLTAGVVGLAALGTAERAKWAVFMAAAIAGSGVLWEGAKFPKPVAGPIGKIVIPAAGVGAPPVKTGCDGAAKKNVDSPLCIDFDCLSKNNETCAVIPNQNCPCLMRIPDPDPLYGNINYLMDQQSLISGALNYVQGCTFVPTTFTLNVGHPPMIGIFCSCGYEIRGLMMATSATSTTTYCNGQQDKPSGWKIVQNDFGVVRTKDVQVSETQQPSPTSVTLPTTTLATTAATTLATSTTTYVDCQRKEAAPFC